MTDIIIDPNKALDRPMFDSEGIVKVKHAPPGTICFLIRLKQDVWNLEQFKGECIIDGIRWNVVEVLRAVHAAPWRAGEMVSLAVKK